MEAHSQLQTKMVTTFLLDYHLELARINKDKLIWNGIKVSKQSSFKGSMNAINLLKRFPKKILQQENLLLMLILI